MKRNKNLNLVVLVVLLFGLLLLSGCSGLGSLNLKTHRYGVVPTQIIWIEVPGLDIEHFAMLRFSLPTALLKIPFEQSECLGKTWSYNLYDLRPSPFNSSLSQILGSKNIKEGESCEAIKEHRPIWKPLFENGHDCGVLEFGTTGDNSLTKLQKCGDEGKNLFKDVILWKMAEAPAREEGLKFFHHDEKLSFKVGETYYDKSCQKTGSCFTSLSKNSELIYQELSKEKERMFLLIRDFSYLNALKNKNLELAKERLEEISKIYQFFLNELEKKELRGRLLLLLSSSSSFSFEFPDQGKDWADFEKRGKVNLTRKSSLLGTVIANGARSENFCGIYDEAEIYRRIFWGPRNIGINGR